MCSLARYTTSQEMSVWLSLPPCSYGDEEDGNGGVSVGGRLGQLVLGEIEDYVVEMARFIDEGSAEQGARDMVLRHIQSAAAAAAASAAAAPGGASPSSLQQHAEGLLKELRTEGLAAEAALIAHVSSIVRRECGAAAARAPCTPDMAVVRELESTIRPKVHRLVELPLWVKAAEYYASQPSV